MTAPYCFDIETLLSQSRPQSLLVIGKGAEAAVANYVQQLETLGKTCRVDRIGPETADQLPDRRYDMGIVTEAAEYLDKRPAIGMLSRLRDLYTRRFCAAVRIGGEWPGLQSTWTRNELLGLGMSLVNRYQVEEGRWIHLYKYDIATYKPAPRWLNPDDWANPELWDKYRW